MRRYLDGKLMDEVAMARLREFEPQALEMHPNGYWLAFSGGKDSVVILDLAKRSGVKFEAIYNLTTVDPPELVRFIKTFPCVRISRPPKTMWQLVREKHMLPLRNARWCCNELKEQGGIGRMVITGVRWAESARRTRRRMVETCYRNKSKRFMNPIIDWGTAAVWEYIRERSLRYCSLYDEGWKRIGCVLCPMTRDIQRQMARWPRLCAAWRRAAHAAWSPELRKQHGAFQTGEEYWRWWLDRDAPSRKDDQPVLFEDDPSLVEGATDGK